MFANLLPPPYAYVETLDPLVSAIALKLYQSLDVMAVLETAAQEIKGLLQCKCVLTYSLSTNKETVWIVEASSSSSSQTQLIPDLNLNPYLLERYQQGHPFVLSQAEINEFSLFQTRTLQEQEISSCLVTPVLHQGQLSGLVLAYPLDPSQGWTEESSIWMQQLSEHLGIALKHATLYQQSQSKLLSYQREEDGLVYDVLHDPLTGLPNRTLLKDRLTQLWELSKRRPDYMFAVLFLDLDRFKVINDSLGHLIGDQLLMEVTYRLKQFLRTGDTIARFGGDEFAILLDGIENAEDAIAIAERIQQSLIIPCTLEGHEVFTTASIGITLSSIERERADDYLRDADTAMYHAKEKGRGCYQVFTPQMHNATISLLQLENDLRRAIERGELRVHYQPIVLLRTNKLKGFEALVRWHHPTKGLISPLDFIPLAEETGLIIPIGYWVLREACLQIKRWQEQFNPTPTLVVSVNLSAKQFSQEGLAEQVEAVLTEIDFDPRRLYLEITESVILENARMVASTLAKLQKLGIRFSLDDFGTGYSSLSYLYRFPIDTLKIDRSFINRVDIDGDKLELVRTIINLAWNLGMDVVAEGVETSKQLAQLRALQCETVQGYYFSQPLSQEDAYNWIADRLNSPPSTS